MFYQSPLPYFQATQKSGHKSPLQGDNGAGSPLAGFVPSVHLGTVDRTLFSGTIETSKGLDCDQYLDSQWGNRASSMG